MSIWSWDGIVPVVDPEAFVHPDATVLGDVIIGPGVYVGIMTDPLRLALIGYVKS